MSGNGACRRVEGQGRERKLGLIETLTHYFTLLGTHRNSRPLTPSLRAFHEGTSGDGACLRDEGHAAGLVNHCGLPTGCLTDHEEKNSPQNYQLVCIGSRPSEPESGFSNDLLAVDGCPRSKENSSPEKDEKVLLLVDMGYPAEVASKAIDICGVEVPVTELTDFIFATQMSKEAETYLGELPCEDEPKKDHSAKNKRKYHKCGRHESRERRGREKKRVQDEDIVHHLPNPMVGFGIPGEPWPAVSRKLPDAATGPPYFYFEVLTHRRLWSKVSQIFFDIGPEFVDSKYFCAAARRRGYVHNLPIQNRCPLLPQPARTIQEALPVTKTWWPSWDPRTQLNSFQTCARGGKLTDRIRRALEKYDGTDPPTHVQNHVLNQCENWNLVWIGRNKAAPLEPYEVEVLLGFPEDYTRGGGICVTDRYKCLANSFQVDTVAYHLSVLKYIFPCGINLFSLFPGIGGAENALHRLGVLLKNVVVVETSKTSRLVFRSWWEQTNQKGNLVDIADVQEVTSAKLEQLITSFGRFDLVIGGSPCDVLASNSNRPASENGDEGEHSTIFFDYFRILRLAKSMLRKIT
ncbi:DNA (cytosine-5)-methyltransferase DRM2-like [Malania oleifera]|uniref:DNA (cytosine-5)-methyltransferase DRM2-like n=1 Tax=Malania oleifera TaxID=397392 RepID=UPI0025AEB89F|nr:DNA (cytosine-5)-methyltransferase DRM2-like [Malania oleifera]